MSHRDIAFATVALGLASLSACGGGGDAPAPLAPPGGLHYTTEAISYINGVSLAPDLPSSTGGAVDSYAVSPALPAGLVLNPATGAISGTPLVAGSGNYTVTASNAGGHASIVLAVSGRDPATGPWMPTGSLGVARAYSSTTLLPNGKVLMAGGAGDAAALHLLGSAEVYDANNGTWTMTGSMGSPRAFHGAVLLDTGKVLAVGGYDPMIGATPGAEIYDPQSGSWSATSPPAIARAFASVTRLADGRVLVAGGFWTASSEIYDPRAQAWMRTGDMISVRAEHSATLLPDGRVVACGGYDAASLPLANCELFDPRTGQWQHAASLAAPRANHGAVLLPEGRVLVASGLAQAAPVSRIDSELYDPPTDSWQSAGSFVLPEVTYGLLPLPDGKVLAIGGDGVTGWNPTAQVHDAATQSWSVTPAPALGRAYFGAVVLPSGRVLLGGGTTSTGAPTASVEIN
jgi:hypothetical protein